MRTLSISIGWKKCSAHSQSILALLFALIPSYSFADPTNFSYSTIGLGFGKVTYDSPICFAGACYEDLGGASVFGSVQFAEDALVVSLSGTSFSNEGYGTRATVGGSSLGLAFVKAVNNKADIGFGISSLSAKAELCAYGVCYMESETGTGYFVGMNSWIDDAKMFSIQLGLSSSQYSNDSITSTSLGIGLYPAKNYEFSLLFVKASDAVNSTSTTMFNYTYHFDSSSPRSHQPQTAEPIPASSNSLILTTPPEPARARIDSVGAAVEPTKDDLYMKLEKLKELMDRGVITPEDFKLKKKELLDRM